MSGTIPLLPLYAFMTWTKTALHSLPFFFHILSSLFSDLTSAVHIDLYRLSRHFYRVPATTQAVIVLCNEPCQCVRFFRPPGHDSFHPAIIFKFVVAKIFLQR